MLKWIETYNLENRYVKVRDCIDSTGTTFCASVPDDVTLDEAIDDYIDGYIKNDLGDWIKCLAILYEGGEEVKRKRFTF
jgi:hypothetical protein